MLRFKVDENRLTLGDLIDLEGANLKTVTNVMSRCLLKDDSAFYPEAEALKVLRALPVSDVSAAADAFRSAIDALKDGAIPPSGGGK